MLKAKYSNSLNFRNRFPSGCKCYSQKLSTYDLMLLRSQGREAVVVEEEQEEESSPRQLRAGKKKKQALTNPT